LENNHAFFSIFSLTFLKMNVKRFYLPLYSTVPRIILLSFFLMYLFISYFVLPYRESRGWFVYILFIQSLAIIQQNMLASFITCMR